MRGFQLDAEAAEQLARCPGLRGVELTPSRSACVGGLEAVAVAGKEVGRGRGWAPECGPECVRY